MTVEQQHEVSPEPDHTCPLIDATIKPIARVEKEMRHYERRGEEELLNLLSFIDSELFWSRDIETQLEKIRSHVSDIRAWGTEWREKALDYHQQLQYVGST